MKDSKVAEIDLYQLLAGRSYAGQFNMLEESVESYDDYLRQSKIDRLENEELNKQAFKDFVKSKRK